MPVTALWVQPAPTDTTPLPTSAQASATSSASIINEAYAKRAMLVNSPTLSISEAKGSAKSSVASAYVLRAKNVPTSTSAQHRLCVWLHVYTMPEAFVPWDPTAVSVISSIPKCAVSILLASALTAVLVHQTKTMLSLASMALIPNGSRRRI